MTVAATARRWSADTFRAGNLHHYWDTEFVTLLETDAKAIASDLVKNIITGQVKQWQAGTPAEWATEAFYVAKADAYGKLPAPSVGGSYRLSDDYVSMAAADVARQLSRAGMRLAFVLNNALRKR